MSIGTRLQRGREHLRLSFAKFGQSVQRDIATPWRINKRVRGAVLLWLGSVSLVVLVGWLQLRSLKPFYTQEAGQPGGVYSEGIVGSISTINPVLAESGANADASQLTFSGLTRVTPKGTIEPDLARSWTISSDGRIYTFQLRSGVTWHDGASFSSADVAFTIGLIQNPDTRSPLRSAWQGVQVAAPDPLTVVLTLPVRYDAFINSTTVGILPQHALNSIPAAQLRVSEFNQTPIGTGPFSVTDFDTEKGSVTLQANQHYYLGKPQLDGIVLKVYGSQDDLQSAFRKHQVMGMARVSASTGLHFGSGVSVHSLSIPEEVALFIRNKNPKLSDVKVRQAISLAIDRKKIVNEVLHGQASALAVPALTTQLPSAMDFEIPKPDVSTAKKLLNGKDLSLTLVTVDTDDYQAVAKRLQANLAKIGVKLTIQAVDAATLQRQYIAPRDYDLMLYGINAGTELDEYPYWHSSQAKAPGLNIAQYSSAAADKALVSARATTDARVRAVRVKSFLDVWSKDYPSVMLYTPKYLYITQKQVRGVPEGQLASPADRFYDVHRWTIQSRLIPR